MGRPLAIAAVTLVACHPSQTYQGVICGGFTTAVDANSSPFDEAPAVTAENRASFHAVITWDDPTNPAPTAWSHHASASDVVLLWSDPDVPCDEPTITLAASSQVEAEGLYYPSNVFVTWEDANAEPFYAVSTVPLDLEGVTEWVVDALDDAGIASDPPYRLFLVIRGETATLSVAFPPRELSPELVEVSSAEVPALGGRVTYLP